MLHGSHGAHGGGHFCLQHGMPLQLGHGAHGAHFGAQHGSHGACVAQPASNKAPAAIANNPVFIIYFPLYFKLKTKSPKVF